MRLHAAFRRGEHREGSAASTLHGVPLTSGNNVTRDEGNRYAGLGSCRGTLPTVFPEVSGTPLGLATPRCSRSARAYECTAGTACAPAWNSVEKSDLFVPWWRPAPVCMAPNVAASPVGPQTASCGRHDAVSRTIRIAVSVRVASCGATSRPIRATATSHRGGTVHAYDLREQRRRANAQRRRGDAMKSTGKLLIDMGVGATPSHVLIEDRWHTKPRCLGDWRCPR